MASRFFEGIAQAEVRTSVGVGKLPCFYRDTASVHAVFTAATSRVAPLLPDADLHPVELRRGRCLVSFAALEHRDSDIGPYSELIVGPLVAFGHRPLPVIEAIAALARRTVHVHVLHLPVTSEIACAAGVELYGYPKFVADVRFTWTPERITCTASEGGQQILTLSAEDLGLYGARRVHARMYSMLQGSLVAGDVELNQLEYAQTLRSRAATLVLGKDHRMAKELAALDVEPRPVLVQVAPRGELVLFGPHPAHVPLGKVG